MLNCSMIIGVVNEILLLNVSLLFDVATLIYIIVSFPCGSNSITILYLSCSGENTKLSSMAFVVSVMSPILVDNVPLA